MRDTTKETGLRIAETEIDLVAVSQQMKEYLIGECKFKGRPFGYQEYLDTRAKLTPEKERGKFFYALFSESGFDERIRDLAEQVETLYLYALEDIVNSRLHPDR